MGCRTSKAYEKYNSVIRWRRCRTTRILETEAERFEKKVCGQGPGIVAENAKKQEGQKDDE